MIADSYLGQDVFILNDQPNWRHGFEVDFKISTDGQTSLTQRETRRPYAVTILTTARFTVTVQDVALTRLMGALRQLNEQPVLEPFWPAVSFWSDLASMKFTAGTMVVFKRDWSQWEIYAPGAEPVWPLPGDLVAPALWGFVASKNLKWINTKTANWSVTFEESGPFSAALAIASDVPDDGPIPAGYAAAPKMFPIAQDHRSTSDEFKVVVRRDQIGFSRDQAETFYPHEVFRGQTSQYVLRGQQDIANFVGFFAARSGPGDAFWGRSGLQACRLAADSLAADTALTVVDASALRGGDWLTAVVGGAIHRAQVLSVVGSTVNLHAAFGVAMTGDFPLHAMNLVRLSSPQVTIKFPSPALAVAKLSWTEVRPEALIPGDETQGETIGRLPTRVVLFHFWRDYRNGTVKHWRFTSFESDVVWDGHTWTSGSWACGDLIKTVNLEDDSVDVTAFVFSGNPLNDDAALTAEAPLSVEITFGDLSI